MILISNILDKETLDHHAKELIDFCKERRWKSSSLAWAPNLTQGVVGTCITTNTSEMLKQRIIDCIVEHVPTFEEINISHYIWQMNSGISVHNDNNYKFSATIYIKSGM
jgi:hypothetical protein